VKDENATTWLIPKLVGEVKFTEWTSEDEMRHPAFLGCAPTKRRSTSFANKHDQPANALLEAAPKRQKRLATVVATGVNYSASMDRDRSAARVAFIG
jgi:ATP-dependent DNA ligase